MTKAQQIINAALAATTYEEAVAVATLIKADIGAAYGRPVGDRWNNYGLMASSGSYEYKALEPVTNMQDAVLERLAASRFGDLTKVPFVSPDEAAHHLLGALNYQQQADRVSVAFRESDPPTRSSKRLTVVYRDLGCGMTPAAVPNTIFALGSSHKTSSAWHQGAYGIGGASTYRNARAVVLVTRRAPEMTAHQDRIAVAVVQWENHGKGQSAFYLTTTDWEDGEGRAAEPWSAPATEYPAFEPGTHLALISYGVEGFHRARSGDEKSFDVVLNTRLYRPIVPVRYTNEITRGKNEYLRGLGRRLDRNPDVKRHEDDEELLYSLDGKTYRLPVKFYVFAPRGEAGERRNFVAKDHAVVFTSNGQAHHHWTPTDFRVRTRLNKLYDRILVVAETDALPIELRTALFTPDRSQLLANEAALQLEDQMADFLNHWHRLVEINNDLVREAISKSSSRGSTLEVARKISAALRIRGFGLSGPGAAGGNNGGTGGPRKRKSVETYPDPTTLEGPDRVIIEDGRVRYLEYMLNAQDDFLGTRGTLTFTCDHPGLQPEDDHIAVGRLRDGYVRVQLAVPEGTAEGEYRLTVTLKDWHRASGGLGRTLSYRTALQIVDDLPARARTAGDKAGRKGADAGGFPAVVWSDPKTYGNGWHNATPGSVDQIAGETLAEGRPEYQTLAALGQQTVPTIVLNSEYAPLKGYITVRAKELTDGGVVDAQDRYAVGAGLGLLFLSQQFEKLAREGKPVDETVELEAKQAVARSVLTMMPAFDTLVKEAGIDE